MRKIVIALAAVMAMAATPMAAQAAPCKDAKGKFIKCPAAKPAPKKPCRDAKGKFTKCPK
ncbi:UNVERIFIED_ORG: Ni/Co efflux regulator RcnB [Sphingomonas sp. R1F5B]